MQRHIPNDYTECREFPEVNAIVYQCDKNGKYYAIAYSGKRGKPDFHYNYKTSEKRNDHVNEYVNSLLSRKNAKDERKSKRVSFRHDVKVGDIFYTSWGYEQTNIDFYQVTEVIGKSSVKIRQIGAKDVSNEQGHSMSATKIAVKGSFLSDEKEMLKRVTCSYRNNPMITISSFELAYLWDGTPKNYSWYG